MRNRFSLLASAFTLVLAVTLAGPSAGVAQTGEEIAPVITINRGACDQLEERPEFELGAMELVEIWGDPDGEEGIAETVLEDEDVDVEAPDADVGADILGEDGVYDENDEGFLAQDFDDDGVIEIGRDLNEDGTLTEDEFLGDDVNGDGALQGDEVLVVVEQAEGQQGPFAKDKVVWKADAEIEGADGQELVSAANYSMVVRQSEERFEIVLACGEILDLVEEDQVVVPLRPVEGSQYTGIALIEKDAGEFAAFLLEGPTVAAPPTPEPPPPTNTPAPTETPPPTDTPVPPTNTPVQVTEVVEEVVTEVVTEVVEVEATQTPTPAS